MTIETLDFGQYAGVPIMRVPLDYLHWILRTGQSRRNRELARAEVKRRSRSARPSMAQRAVEAEEKWPCPSGCVPNETSCVLCRHSGGLFDPSLLLRARELRDARCCTQKDAAAALGMSPQRLSEMEDGRDLAPDSYGGPERRRAAAEKLIAYLQRLQHAD
jgi:hypothetical protein